MSLMFTFIYSTIYLADFHISTTEKYGATSVTCRHFHNLNFPALTFRESFVIPKNILVCFILIFLNWNYGCGAMYMLYFSVSNIN